MRRLTHWLWLTVLAVIALRPWVLDLVLPERILIVHWAGIASALAWWLTRQGWRHAPSKALLIPCALLFLGYMQGGALSTAPIEALLQSSALLLGILLFFGTSQASVTERKQLLVILAASGTALAIKGLWLEPGCRFTAGRRARLEAELERLRRFAGADRIVFADDYLRTTA